MTTKPIMATRMLLVKKSSIRARPATNPATVHRVERRKTSVAEAVRTALASLGSSWRN